MDQTLVLKFELLKIAATMSNRGGAPSQDEILSNYIFLVNILEGKFQQEAKQQVDEEIKEK